MAKSLEEIEKELERVMETNYWSSANEAHATQQVIRSLLSYLIEKDKYPEGGIEG